MTKIPTINISGKTYEAQKPKARIWRELCKFDEEKKNLLAGEFLDAHAEIIAKVFDGVTKDEILDELFIDEILVIYQDVFAWIAGLITSRLSEIKNAESEEAST